MPRRLVIAATALAALPFPAAAQNYGMKERVILGTMNICWDAERGGNLGKLTYEAGFDPTPQAQRPLYYRDVEGTVVFLSADFGPGDDGLPEPACRITALKPQVGAQWTPRGAILPDFNALLDRLISGAATMESGYRVVYRGQPNPRRPGTRHTLLRMDEGPRARLIYVEEAPTHYEFLYVRGSRKVVFDPSTLEIGTLPAGRTGMQAFVTDRYEIAFCNLNPHACETPEQRRSREQMARNATQARPPIAIPFSGIGSTGGGDNRSNEQKLRDKAWWENYHRCGRGKC
ncbi:MAG: hypothetical protein KF730_11720 [Sphingomonas sp.]|uniref:hypothetical protein n=1 Tax=Sphingomonas sp. TaxID=28214 RepID=UPI0025DBB3A9|nr:hypothetical protein [Sphingomonas sp.]MBX3565227.1 hypothetical protein [Sphingomonas sp.]